MFPLRHFADYQRQPNPVLRREMSARWRTNKAFFVVFGYTIALVLLAYWNYSGVATKGVLLDDQMRPTSLPGRDMFVRFNQWQMAGWLIFAPLLTAGAIAGEREGGMLESLLLSHLTPEQIAWGKWWSAMAFVSLMLLVPLPVGAICFQMGGVAPLEFVTAALLQAATAALGLAIGLYCSAKADRTDRALGKALSLVFWWAWLGPLVLLPLAFSDVAVGILLLIVILPIFYSITQSLIVMAAGESLRPIETLAPEVKRSSFDWVASDLWVDWENHKSQTAYFEMGKTGATESKAIVTEWVGGFSDKVSETRTISEQAEARLVTRPAPLHSSLYETLLAPEDKALLGDHTGVNGADAREQELAFDDPERYKRWDMPGADLLLFENPVLQREVRTHLRLRAEKVGNRGEGGNIAGIFAFFCFGLYSLKLLGNEESRADSWGLFSTLWILSAVFAAAAMAAGAFTRERASRMLDFLWLTCLTSRQILWGKVAGAVVVVAYYSIALAPVLLPCLLPKANGRPGLDWGHISGTLLLVVTATWASAAWAAMVSWLCKQTFVATAISLLGLLLFPYLPGMKELNPLAAAGRLFPFNTATMTLRELPQWTPRDVWHVPLGLFLLGALYVSFTLWLIRFGPRAKDDAR